MNRPLILLAALLFVLTALGASAHLGPKLVMGVSPQSDPALVELLCFYLEEKTGIGTNRLELREGEVQAALKEKRIDFILMPAGAPIQAPLQIDYAGARLFAMPRIVEDLAFSTALPALKKLSHRVRSEGLAPVYRAVEEGASPGSAARFFLLRRGWI